jgi:membrane-associated phospholipid phosphatase
MGSAVVYGGEHYAVDVLVGVALAAAAWRWARRPDGAAESASSSALI